MENYKRSRDYNQIQADLYFLMYAKYMPEKEYYVVPTQAEHWCCTHGVWMDWKLRGKKMRLNITIER